MSGNNNPYGIRPVVSLKPGVEIAENNTGTGAYNSAYTLESLTPKPEKLDIPTISITEDTLTITSVTNATSYDIYTNGVLRKTTTLSIFDLTELNLGTGTYEITIKAKANGYIESDFSEGKEYIVDEITPLDYLVDKVVIGDYVDIEISYNNPTKTTSVYLSGKDTAMYGWRVLSKEGTGATGTVTLVSAGAPLRFYYDNTLMDPQNANNTYFKNLNTSISTVADNRKAVGFTANGFNSLNLADIWSSNTKINASTAHALTTTELETAYKALTGETKTIEELSSLSSPLLTSSLSFKDTATAEKGIDFLGNGISYWLGESINDDSYLWLGSSSGRIYVGRR